MIVKCYSIAYKYSWREYNIILLAWIIWCLTYGYIFFYFDASFSHFITINMIFSLPFYTYFSTWKRLLLSLSLSLSHVLFLWEFFIFCISTLNWCIYVFFRILLWVAIWFCVFKLLSFIFFFSIIVKCYFIAYKYILQEYNVILLYIMT